MRGACALAGFGLRGRAWLHEGRVCPGGVWVERARPVAVWRPRRPSAAEGGDSGALGAIYSWGGIYNWEPSICVAEVGGGGRWQEAPETRAARSPGPTERDMGAQASHLTVSPTRLCLRGMVLRLGGKLARALTILVTGPAVQSCPGTLVLARQRCAGLPLR